MSLYKISDIEKIYPSWYDHSHSLSRDDQQFIWENTPLTQEDENKLRYSEKTEHDVSLIGSVNGGSKLTVNTVITLTKGEAILALRKSNYKMAPKEVASYLEIIFSRFQAKNGHWLFIAQHYTPKTINCLITEIIKRIQRGEMTLRNPASYFTDIILRHRKMRKKFRGMKFRIKSKEEFI